MHVNKTKQRRRTHNSKNTNHSTGHKKGRFSIRCRTSRPFTTPLHSATRRQLARPTLSAFSLSSAGTLPSRGVQSGGGRAAVMMTAARPPPPRPLRRCHLRDEAIRASPRHRPTAATATTTGLRERAGRHTGLRKRVLRAGRSHRLLTDITAHPSLLHLIHQHRPAANSLLLLMPMAVQTHLLNPRRRPLAVARTLLHRLPLPAGVDQSPPPTRMAAKSRTLKRKKIKRKRTSRCIRPLRLSMTKTTPSRAQSAAGSSASTRTCATGNMSLTAASTAAATR